MMVNVLSVIHYAVFGGPHNQALQLAERLRSGGFETIVLLPQEEGNALERLQEGGVEVIAAPLGRIRALGLGSQVRTARSFWADVMRIRQVIRDRRVGLVQLNGLVNPHAAIAARLEGVPIVWQLLDTRAPSFVVVSLMPIVWRLAAAIMVTGQRVAALHLGARANDPRVFVFAPPVDRRVFYPSASDRERVRGRLGVMADTLLIGTVANITRQKGLEYFVEAAALGAALLPSARFVLFGSVMPSQRAYTDALLARIKELDGAGHVDIAVVDPGESVAACMRALDIFVLSSVRRSEGMPTTILEALSCGVAVVATDVGSVRELLTAPSSGIVVQPESPAALASGLVELSRSLDRTSPAARSRLTGEHFPIEQCAYDHVRAYRFALRS